MLSAIWKLKLTHRSSLLPGEAAKLAAKALNLKVRSPAGVKQPTSCIHPDEKALVRYLPDFMRFCAFSDASVRNRLEGGDCHPMLYL